MKIKSFIVLVFVLAGANFAFAQTTEFTYQGRLVDGSLPANTPHDFEFRLFSVNLGGAALATNQRLGVAVSNGVFTVRLDFSGNFGGSDRWIEIAVKPAGSPNPFTVLNPRQPLTSTPYSIRSLNSANADNATNAATATNSLQLGGVAANQFVQTNDSRLTDARNPLPNSGSYVQNTTAPQTGSNFNITGDGTAGGTLTGNAVTSTTQFNVGIHHALSIRGLTNVFAGRLSGVSNTTGSGNSYFGESAGRFNTTSSNNSFFGRGAGEVNTASSNSFFGAFSGEVNTTGQSNSFFGSEAGAANTTGDTNSFFGFEAGFANTAGFGSSFFGGGAGGANTSGVNNVFVGLFAGNTNTIGNANVFVGTSAGNTNTFGDNNTTIGHNTDVGGAGLAFATAVGSGTVVSSSNTIQLGRTNGSDTVFVPGRIIVTLGSAGATDVCRNGSNQLSTCSSSLRYKMDVLTYSRGLDVVRRLRPIGFRWNSGGIADIGFGAEEVNEVEPLLATRNDKGEIEGVKYKQISTVLVNAVNEQQQIIEQQQREIDALKQKQLIIDELKKFICEQNPNAELCGRERK